MGIEDKIDLKPEGELELIKIRKIEVPKDEKDLIKYLRNLRSERVLSLRHLDI